MPSSESESSEDSSAGSSGSYEESRSSAGSIERRGHGTRETERRDSVSQRDSPRTGRRVEEDRRSASGNSDAEEAPRRRTPSPAARRNEYVPDKRGEGFRGDRGPEPPRRAERPQDQNEGNAYTSDSELEAARERHLRPPPSSSSESEYDSNRGQRGLRAAERGRVRNSESLSNGTRGSRSDFSDGEPRRGSARQSPSGTASEDEEDEESVDGDSDSVQRSRVLESTKSTAFVRRGSDGSHDEPPTPDGSSLGGAVYRDGPGSAGQPSAVTALAAAAAAAAAAKSANASATNSLSASLSPRAERAEAADTGDNPTSRSSALQAEDGGGDASFGLARGRPKRQRRRPQRWEGAPIGRTQRGSAASGAPTSRLSSLGSGTATGRGSRGGSAAYLRGQRGGRAQHMNADVVVDENESTASLRTAGSSSAPPRHIDTLASLPSALRDARETADSAPVDSQKDVLIQEFHAWQLRAISAEASHQKTLHVYLKRRLRKRVLRSQEQDRIEEEALRNACSAPSKAEIAANRSGHSDEDGTPSADGRNDSSDGGCTESNTKQSAKRRRLQGMVVPSQVRLPLESYLPRRVRRTHTVLAVEDLINGLPQPPVQLQRL